MCVRVCVCVFAARRDAVSRDLQQDEVRSFRGLMVSPDCGWNGPRGCRLRNCFLKRVFGQGELTEIRELFIIWRYVETRSLALWLTFFL